MTPIVSYVDETNKTKLHLGIRKLKIPGMFLALPSTLFLVFFFIVPVILLFITSFFKASSFVIHPILNIDNYSLILFSRGFWLATWQGAQNGLLTAAFSLVLSYPVAYYLVYRARSNILLYAVLWSWFSSYLVRIYAWRTILGTNGVVNNVLMHFGIIDHPLNFIIFSPTACVIALLHIMLPFALLIIVSSLRDVKKEYLEAARDLGASGFAVLWKVILPMSYKGIVGSFMFTFILSSGDYIIPQLLGGLNGVTTGLLISNQFRSAGNWPLGSAMAFLLMATFAVTYLVLLQVLKAAKLTPRQRYHG